VSSIFSAIATILVLNLIASLEPDGTEPQQFSKAAYGGQPGGFGRTLREQHPYRACRRRLPPKRVGEMEINENFGGLARLIGMRPNRDFRPGHLYGLTQEGESGAVGLSG
jgi:hypothetical protein